MKNKIGNKLSRVKRLFLSMAGVSVLGIPLALGIINAPVTQADSFDNNIVTREHKTDTLQLSGKPEKNNESFLIINEEQDQSKLKNVSNAGISLQTVSSNEPVLKTESPAIAMANINIQTARNSEKKAESFKTPREGVLSTGTKDRIEVAQMDTPVKNTADEGNNDIEIKKEDADKYISRGISFLKKGRYEDAVSNFNRAVNIDPGSAVAYVARGSVYYRMNKLDDAISDYSRALELNPNLAVVYQDRGSIYQLQDRFDDAVSDYSKALKLDPGNAVFYNYRGSAYFARGQYQKAYADFNKAIELNPKYVSAYINRGAYYNTENNIKSASADYRKALELDPEGAFSKKIRDYLRYADSQIIECHKIRSGPGWRNVCKTKAEWAGRDKIWSTAHRSSLPTPTMNGMDFYAGQIATQNLARGK